MSDFQIVVRELDKDAADAMRAQIVRTVLHEHVCGLKEKLDPARWVNSGWSEVEAFVEALCHHGIHPALLEWEAGKDQAGRPVPSTREEYARRLIVLMCVGLERAGLNRRAARKFAARELAPTGVFASAPSHRTIEHWQEKKELELTAGDELLVATGFAVAGGEPHRIAIYFIGLCHLALNPTAVALREGSQEGGGYIGSFDPP